MLEETVQVLLFPLGQSRKSDEALAISVDWKKILGLILVALPPAQKLCAVFFLHLSTK